MSDFFHRIAKATSKAVGSPWAFLIALTTIAVWVLTGSFFHYSDTWQLVINTGTTIVTFLVVFLIQNTQNRDSEAVHLKLDELIRALRGASNTLVDLENLTDSELERLHLQFEQIRLKASARQAARGAKGVATPTLPAGTAPPAPAPEPDASDAPAPKTTA